MYKQSTKYAQNCYCFSSYLHSYLYPHHLDLISFLSSELHAAQDRRQFVI